MNKDLQKALHTEFLKGEVKNALCFDIKSYEDGLFLTLNSVHDDRIKFEKQLEQFSWWLNDYCYGRSYQSNKKRLKFVAVTEVGNIYQGLHAHILLMFNNDINKDLKELENFIKDKWRKLINAKTGPKNNLVDIQHIGNVSSRVDYVLKNFSFDNQGLNPLYF